MTGGVVVGIVSVLAIIIVIAVVCYFKNPNRKYSTANPLVNLLKLIYYYLFERRKGWELLIRT